MSEDRMDAIANALCLLVCLALLAVAVWLAAACDRALPEKPNAVEGREYWVDLRDGTRWSECDERDGRGTKD